MRLTLLLPAVFSFLVTAVGAAEKPNLLVILADDLGYSDLSCYGGEIHTPHIDALARGGVRFTQCYNSARCCPSRASLMTGLYPSQAGIGDFTTPKPSPNRGPGYLGRLNDQCVTLAEVLKPAGYGCYYVGKWHMHEETGPIKRGFDEFYGYTRDHSHDQYDRDYYVRLPEDRKPELEYPADGFYATDAFNDYALEFIRQGQASDRPWFLFLGHSSPHFPIQAPAERADKYQAVYQRGWDVLREERFARMKQLGLVDGEHWKLTARSLVPVDREDIANGFPGQPNPAWDTLDQDRQHDLARRMAVFAAMVQSLDESVGRIIEHLESTGDLANTLVLFLSDNGACYEWGPFGFDGPSRQGTTTLRTGDEVRQIGGPGTHQSYGSGWANLGNTPFQLYKHFTHEGGICTPLIAHWPKGIGSPNMWVRDPVHVMDILPTLLEVTGASYPTELRGNAILPPEGTSLVPVMRGGRLPERALGFEHQAARALRQGDWKLVWSKRMPHDIDWELYNLAEDRCETQDLAAKHPDRVKAMAAQWEQWARRVQVIYEPRPSADGSQERSRKPVPASAFIQQKTDRKPSPVMDAETFRAGLESHDRALYIKAGWIRDPYIMLGPDDYYYLTGTQPREGAPREADDPYNIGLGDGSIVGDQVRVWRSRDLIAWESLGPIFTVDDTVKARSRDELASRLIWAPELHWLGDRWALVHCPKSHSSLALTPGRDLKGPWTHPMEDRLGERHDPSLFHDDGTWYLLWGNTLIAPLSHDLSRYTAEPVRIDPAGSRTNVRGQTRSVIGHEGATMLKMGRNYIHLGTAWSTDQIRRGSYNLYYCVADRITGPYGPRKFAGRFLGHGTPFQTRDGKWWCTAFFNANVPPLPREGIETRDLSEDAQTINEQGVTIVPLDVRVLYDGDVFLRAKDPAYAAPGPDEVQEFERKD